MRILHILNHIQEIGNGIVNVAVDLACLQAEAGEHVAIASAGGEYENLLAKYGVKHFALDQKRTPINLLKAARDYRGIVREFQPDIVHTHMMTGVVLARVLRGKASYAIVSTVHNEFQRSSVLMGLADRVIAVSEAVARSMSRRGIPQNKLRVVRNGTIGSPRTQKIAEYQPLPLQRPAIATVAGMFKRKGITELVAAFEQIADEFPETHLYLVGEGSDRAMFEAQAQATRVGDRIHFEGFQPKPQRYLLSTDIFVLVSHHDPCPLVLSEAREAGCAIVASDVDGIPEALEGGMAGTLVPPVNSSALAAALRQLLSDSEAMRMWQERAKENLDWLSAGRVHRETLAVYGELTEKAGGNSRVRLEELQEV